MGPRKFLHSGKLFKAKSSKELYGFLFNDFLLLTQVTKPLGSSGSDKVFSSKTHLQYRMYKTVRQHTHASHTDIHSHTHTISS